MTGSIGPIQRSKFEDLIHWAGTKLEEMSGSVAPTAPTPTPAQAFLNPAGAITHGVRSLLSGSLHGAGTGLQDQGNKLPLVRAEHGLMSLQADPRILDVADVVTLGAAGAGSVARAAGKSVVQAGDAFLRAGVEAAPSIVAGKKARTADLKKLAEAEKLEAEIAEKQIPMSPEDARSYIYKKTGWWRGKNGKWRWWLDDSKAKIRKETLHPGNIIRGIGGKGADGVPLHSVMEHDALYDAYPELMQARTGKIYYDSHRSRAGHFDPRDNSVHMRAPDPESMRDGLLHEANHGVQNAEGFAPGGSPEGAEELIRKMLENDSHLPPEMRLSNTDLFALMALGKEPVRAYKLLSGEAESRMVERLSHYSPDGGFLPWEQFDVPESQHLILTGNRDKPISMMAADGADAPSSLLPTLEANQFRVAKPADFNAALAAARAQMDPRSALQVDAALPADFKGKVYMTPDGLTGFAVSDTGYVSNLFKHPNAPYRDAMGAALGRARKEGGRSLDAFDTGLAAGYAKRGAVESGRSPWNPEYAPEGWDVETMGTPDYVSMKLPPPKPKRTKRNPYTVRDPERITNPGIYLPPSDLISAVRAKFVPESPLLKRLWGEERDSLFEISLRAGNEPGLIPKGAARPQVIEHAEKVKTSANENRIIDAVSELRRQFPEAYRAFHGWYVMDPVHRRMVELVGEHEAFRRYLQLNGFMARESPNLAVPGEIKRGTAANMMAEQGRMDVWRESGGLGADERGVPELAAVPGRIGGRRIAQSQTDLMEMIRNGASIRDLVAVMGHKDGVYSHASGVPATGFQTDLFVGDAHKVRSMGLADTRPFAPGDSWDPERSITKSELQSLAPWHANIAEKLDMQPVPLQSTEWNLFGPQTGVKSPLGPGKLELFSEEIGRAAERRGVTPETARDMILLGQAHAGKIDPDLLNLLAIAAAPGVPLGTMLYHRKKEKDKGKKK